MELMEWYEKAMTYEEYVNHMQVNREELLSLYKKVNLKAEEVDFFRAFREKNWKMLVIAADWCTDALLCIPIMKRISEVANFSMRFLIRDENLELMDQYLTNGSRSIPIFIFIDENGEEVAVWGPRSPEVQARIEELRATLPAKDDPDFEEKQKMIYQQFRQEVLIKASIWQSVKNSIRAHLGALKVEEKHA